MTFFLFIELFSVCQTLTLSKQWRNSPAGSRVCVFGGWRLEKNGKHCTRKQPSRWSGWSLGHQMTTSKGKWYLTCWCKAFKIIMRVCLWEKGENPPTCVSHLVRSLLNDLHLFSDLWTSPPSLESLCCPAFPVRPDVVSEWWVFEQNFCPLPDYCTQK